MNLKSVSQKHEPSLLKSDLVCLSHLRWDFVYQRPQHLLTRFAKERRVFFFEEPLFDLAKGSSPFLELRSRRERLTVAVPHLPENLKEGGAASIKSIEKFLLDQMIESEEISDFLLWYYTPMSLAYTAHLKPKAIVYDCMDELSHFKNAPKDLREFEAKLFEKADLVFTGGLSLYEAKQGAHENIHPFPSSIDFKHFEKARYFKMEEEPLDQRAVSQPRVGFFGVIDERMDLDLVRAIAEAKPQWNFIFLGPVVKINPDSLPKLPNIHYLGSKTYAELPAYIAGWQVAILPFAMNDSTKFISPTKTPEYLAAGRPVVSTPIRDVVRPYARQGLARIAATAEDFIEAIEASFRDKNEDSFWLKVDAFLAQNSWDRTWQKMSNLIEEIEDSSLDFSNPTLEEVAFAR